MSTENTDTSSESLPSVPSVDNPRPSPPLTENFNTGTATDPAIGTNEERSELTVDGQKVTVQQDATLLDAVKSVGADEDISALCYYDREDTDQIGPRSECRTCMVETDEHGLVPSCSFPADDGITVRTDSEEAEEARSVNLDLVLSDHNLRCTTCGKNGRCELQDAAIDADVEAPDMAYSTSATNTNHSTTPRHSSRSIGTNAFSAIAVLRPVTTYRSRASSVSKGQVRTRALGFRMARIR